MMSFKSKAFNKFALIVCAAFATVPAVANAAVISVNSNLNGKTVDAGKSLNGVFNFGTQLVGQHIDSLTVSASFFQNRNAKYVDTNQGQAYYDSTSYFDYCCGIFTCEGKQDNWTRTDVANFYDTAATAKLGFAGMHNVVNTTKYVDYTSNYATSQERPKDDESYKKYINVTTDKSTTGYAGLFETTFTLTAADIAALTTSNSLAFTVGALANGFKINNLSLTANTVAVPEPGSLLLLGLGFTGLLAARRRKLF